jgi:phosphate transport system substrate-binding protein
MGLLTLLVGMVGALPSTASTGVSTQSGTLVGAGESWPEYTVSKLRTDAGTANQTGGLQTTYVSGRSEDPARQDLAAGSADYVVSEAAMSSAEASTAQGNGITPAYVPYGIGSVAIVASLTLNQFHNKQEISGVQLKIPTLAKIFTKVITQWNDSEIAAENPSINFNDMGDPSIQLVVRGDSSSTTSAMISMFLADPQAAVIWNNYAAARGEPKDTPLDQWPNDGNGNVHTTTGSKGEVDGVLGLNPDGTHIGQYDSNIGYLSPEWAKQYSIKLVKLQNHASTPAYVLPTDNGAISAAMANATFDSNTNLYTIDYKKITADGSWPMPLVSYFIVPTSGESSAKDSALASFITFILGSNGQADVTGTSMISPSQDAINGGLRVAAALQQSSATTTSSSSSSTSSTTPSSTTSTIATTNTTASPSATSTSTSSPGTTAAHGATTTAILGHTAAASNGGGTDPGTPATNGAGVSLPRTGGSRQVGLIVAGVLLMVIGHAGYKRARRSRR